MRCETHTFGLPATQAGCQCTFCKGEHTATSLLECFLSEVLEQSDEYNLLSGRQCKVADSDWGICFRYTATRKHSPVESLNPIY